MNLSQIPVVFFRVPEIVSSILPSLIITAASFGPTTMFLKNPLNSDLSNDYGNLAQRVLTFIYKNNECLIPNKGSYTLEDKELLKDMGEAKDNIINYMQNYQVTNALEELWKVIREANSYIDTEAPWSLKNTDIDRMNTVLNTLCIVIKKISLIALNFTPDGANKILDQLSISKKDRKYRNFDDPLDNAKIKKPEGVFPRLEKIND